MMISDFMAGYVVGVVVAIVVRAIHDWLTGRRL